jgi:Domain of unknown function (DUF4326)
VSPQRIQLRRVKGWRKPDGAVVVSRPTKWGNPLRIVPERDERGRQWYRVARPDGTGPAYVGLDVARHFAARFFEWDLLNGRFPDYPGVDVIRAELAGLDLCCWCPLGQPCHAATLLALANSGEA